MGVVNKKNEDGKTLKPKYFFTKLLNRTHLMSISLDCENWRFISNPTHFFKEISEKVTLSFILSDSQESNMLIIQEFIDSSRSLP
jgi:hypothetical protein